MTTYWMMTLMVQSPILIFILMTDLFAPIRLPFMIVADSILSVLVLTELLVSFFHTQKLLRNELRVMKLANESWRLTDRIHLEPNCRPCVRNTEAGPIVEWMTNEERNAYGIDGRSTDSDSEESDNREPLQSFAVGPADSASTSESTAETVHGLVSEVTFMDNQNVP